MSSSSTANPGKIIKQQFYHKMLPCGLNNNFDSEREFFWSEIVQMLVTKDVVYQAGIAGSNIKQLIVKFKNVYGLKRNEQQMLITLLMEMLLTRKDVRTDSKVLLFSFLNEMLSTKDDFPDFKLDWRAFYEFYEDQFHNNQEKPFHNEQHNISLFSQFIDLVKKSKKYFDASSIPEVYEMFKQNFTPSKADHSMNFLTLFLKIDSDAPKSVYQDLLSDLVQYLNFGNCSRNTLSLYNIMKILRQFKSLPWEKYYDEIFTIIFRNLNNLLILDTIVAEENIMNTLMSEEPIRVKSIMKQIPDFLVHLLLPSTHANYEMVWQYIERIFLLVDRVFDPNNKAEQCDQLLKLLKGFVRKFIIRYDQEQTDLHNLADPSIAQDGDDQDDVLDLDFNTSQYNIPQYMQEIYRNKGTTKSEFEPTLVLDEGCKERFLQLIDKFLKKIVYMEDMSHSSCKTLMWLCYFDPSRYVVPIIEHAIASFEYIDKMALSTVKNIVLFIMPLLCDRKLCPTGLKYIPQFLKCSYKLFEIQGVKENIDLIEAYSKLFMVVPVEKYKDLVDQFKIDHPDKSEKQLQEMMVNEEEANQSVDVVEFVKQLEVFALKYFKLIVDNLTTMDMAESESCTLIIDFNNIFWSFIVNSSHSLRLNYLDLLFNKLRENILSEAQQEIAYLLDCFSLTEPEAVLSKTIELIEQRLLKPRTDMSTIDKLKTNVMWHFLENNENRDRILSKEFALFNETSIKYFVNILENSMSYARSHIIKHLDTIETVAFLCSFQDDLTVFEKSCDIIHTVILTLGFVYPTEVWYLNPSEKNRPDNKYKYLSRLSKTDLKKFELDWYNPSAEERKIILSWLDKSLMQVIRYFKINYFDKPEQFPLLDYEKDYMVIINNLLFDDQSDNILQVSKQQKEFYKVLYVALASFSGINVRVPFNKQQVKDGQTTGQATRQKKQREIYDRFESLFMFEELSSLRNDLINVCLHLPSIFHHTKTIQDSQLIEMFQYICRECFGESYLIDEIKKSNDMLDGLCTLNDFHRPNLFTNRFSLASECITYLNEKIDLFFFLNPYIGDQKIQLFNSFFILSFHPSYQFRMSIRFDQDLVFEEYRKNPYEDMHIKVFKIMNHFIFEQQIFKKESTPVIEKVQEFLLSNLRIEQVQRFPCCSANPDSFRYIFSAIEVFEQIDKKVWQQKVVEQIMKTLTSTYQDSYLFKQLRKDVQSKSPINPLISTCAGYEKFKENIPMNRESISLKRALEVKEAFLDIIKEANNKLENPKVHWKTKILCGLFVVYFLNVIDDLNHPEIARFARISMGFAADTTDNHISQYGRSILFRLFNLRKRRTVKKSYEPKPGCYGPVSPSMEAEDLREGEYTFEEFLTYRFLKKSDLTSYLIKNREIGTYFDYGKLYNKDGYAMEESEGLFAKTVCDTVLNEEYFSNLVTSIFEAKEIYVSESDDTDQEQTHVDLSQSEVFDQIQILFNFTFDSDKKKISLFNINLNFNLFEFYARLFKKIFQALGHRFFEISHKKIESLVDDFNSLPRQRVISIYVWSILKWIQRLPRDQRQLYMDFCVKISSTCVVNCSLELFKDWMMSVSFAAKNNSYEVMEEYGSRLLDVLKVEKGLGKRFRYHKLLKVMVSLNQCWARKYAIEGLNLIISTEVEDLKECNEHNELFTEILCSGILNRINTRKVREEKWIKGGLQPHIEAGNIVIQDEYSSFENNSLIVSFIDAIFQKLKTVKNDAKKKLYSHMAFKVLETINVRRMNDLFWTLFRQFFMYILDNKPDNVNEIEILKFMACNEYPAHIRKDLKDILSKKIGSENWVSRQKVLLFCKNFLYFESYSENAVKIDPIVVQGLSDKNNSVSLLAIDCLSDVVKIATKDEQLRIFTTYRAQASSLLPKEKGSEEYKSIFERKQIAVSVLMALLLAFQEEVLPWTEEALREVIAAKTLNPNMKKKVKEFVGKYWRDQTEVISFNSLTLSDYIKKQIREIANPYDYFA